MLVCKEELVQTRGEVSPQCADADEYSGEYSDSQLLTVIALSST